MLDSNSIHSTLIPGENKPNSPYIVGHYPSHPWRAPHQIFIPDNDALIPNELSWISSSNYPYPHPLSILQYFPPHDNDKGCKYKRSSNLSQCLSLFFCFVRLVFCPNLHKWFVKTNDMKFHFLLLTNYEGTTVCMIFVF